MLEIGSTAEMRLEVVAIFFFFHAHYTEGHSEVRIDDRGEYYIHQNIVQAFDTSQPPWLYGYNFEGTRVEGENMKKLLEIVKVPCAYFKKDSLSSTHANFSRHEYVDQKKEKTNTTHLYGAFYKTLGLAEQSRKTLRTAPNAINVSYAPGGVTASIYKLVYSDYNNCAIIRPFSPGSPYAEFEGSSYYGTGGHCVLLLSDAAARNMDTNAGKKDQRENGENGEGEREKEKAEGERKTSKGVGKALPPGLSEKLPKGCRLIYTHACGSKPFTVVFKQTCPKIPSPLGC